MRIAQLSDCHITVPGRLVADRVDPLPGLAAAVEAANRLDVDLVVGTGDLVDTGTAPEYDVLERALAGLEATFLAIPGNHDDRSELRRRFELPAGAPDEPIDHVVTLGDVTFVCLDTTIPGRHDGRLSAAQLAWLDDQLSAPSTTATTTSTTTVVVQHHPLFPSGLPFMDRPYHLVGADAERSVIERHDHVVAVWSGHHHRHAQRVVGRALATVAPSTAVSLAAAFGQETTVYSDEACGLLLHEIDAAASVCTTRFVALDETERWTPEWV